MKKEGNKVPNYHETAWNFWTNREEYPNYPHALQRRLIDANYVTKRTRLLNSILDLGCGDGSLLLSLREFTQISKFYGYDISKNLLNMLINKWGNCPGLTVKETDFLYDTLPEVAVTTSFGSFSYVFEDEQLHVLLKNVNSSLLIVRASCTLKKENELIKTFSEDIGAEYASIYRTVNNLISILSEHFIVSEVDRAYPDEIESKYGTKHFFFVCRSMLFA
jgi:SAM-dependent methyltransferase